MSKDHYAPVVDESKTLDIGEKERRTQRLSQKKTNGFENDFSTAHVAT